MNLNKGRTKGKPHARHKYLRVEIVNGKQRYVYQEPSGRKRGRPRKNPPPIEPKKDTAVSLFDTVLPLGVTKLGSYALPGYAAYVVRMLNHKAGLEVEQGKPRPYGVVKSVTRNDHTLVYADTPLFSPEWRALSAAFISLNWNGAPEVEAHALRDEEESRPQYLPFDEIQKRTGVLVSHSAFGKDDLIVTIFGRPYSLGKLYKFQSEDGSFNREAFDDALHEWYDDTVLRARRDTPETMGTLRYVLEQPMFTEDISELPEDLQKIAKTIAHAALDAVLADDSCSEATTEDVLRPMRVKVGLTLTRIVNRFVDGVCKMRRNPKNAKFLPHPAGLHTQLDRILRNQGVPDTYLRGLRPQLDEAVAEADDKLMLSPGDLLPWREWTESSWLPGEKEAEILKWTKSFREGGYTGPAATRKAKNRVGNWDTGSRHHPRISYEAEGTYSATIPTVDGDPLIHRVAFANSSDGWDGLQKWYSAQVALAIKQGKLDPTSAHGRAVLDSLPELRLKYVSPKLADVVAAAEQMRPYAATTIEEAETYLKALGVGKVSLANLDIRIANAVVDTIRDEYVRFPNHEASLHSVTTAALARGSTMMSMAYGGSLEIRWKKMDYDRLAATAKNNADAGGWSRNRRAQMETNIRAAEEIVTEQQKLAKDALAKYAATQDLSHLEEARRRQRYARKYGGYLRSYRRDLAKIESTPKGVEQVWSCGWGSGDSPERITRELVRHEMGHRHHATQPGARQWASDAFGVCKRLGQFPSEYSQTNSSELFADSYGFYMTGYEHRLPAHVLTYFETHFGEAKAKKTT